MKTIGYGNFDPNIKLNLRNLFNKYDFSLDFFKKIGEPDNKCPKNNNESYLTDEEFKTFSKCEIVQYIFNHKTIILPVFLWKIFAWFSEVKFGSAVSIDTVIKNQCQESTRCVTCLIRNDICGYYELIMNYKKANQYTEIKKTIEKHTDAKGISIYQLLENTNLFNYKKENFWDIISKIFYVAFENESFKMLYSSNDFANLRNYISKSKNEDKEYLLFEIIMNTKIRNLTGSNKFAISEKNEFNNLLGILSHPVYINKNKISDILCEFSGDINVKWNVYSVINYQILNNINTINFYIDENQEIIKISTGEDELFIIEQNSEYSKKRKIKKVQDEEYTIKKKQKIQKVEIQEEQYENQNDDYLIDINFNDNLFDYRKDDYECTFDLLDSLIKNKRRFNYVN